MCHRIRIGTGDHETKIRFVRQRGPHLLATDKPFTAGFIEACLGLDVSEVRSCTRFRISLTPQLGTGHDPRQVFLFLCLGAKGDQRQPCQALADVANASRRSGAGVLLKENDLLLDRTAASTVFLGPTDAGPPPRRKIFFPDLALFGIGVFVAGTTPVFQLFEFAGQVSLQPPGHFFPKLFVLGTEAQFHNLILNPANVVQCARGEKRHCRADVPMTWRA